MLVFFSLNLLTHNIDDTKCNVIKYFYNFCCLWQHVLEYKPLQFHQTKSNFHYTCLKVPVRWNKLEEPLAATCAKHAVQGCIAGKSMATCVSLTN